jgi:hypothetical protein
LIRFIRVTQFMRRHAQLEMEAATRHAQYLHVSVRVVKCLARMHHPVIVEEHGFSSL